MAAPGEWVGEIVAAAGVVATGVIGWLYKAMHKRIDDMENGEGKMVKASVFDSWMQRRDEQLQGLADGMKQQKEDAQKQFDRIGVVLDRTEARFLSMDKEQRIRHDALSATQTQILVAVEALKK